MVSSKTKLEINPKFKFFRTEPQPKPEEEEEDAAEQFLYLDDSRIDEVERVTASLKAGSSLLVLGKPGIGKTSFKTQVFVKLATEGYRVIVVPPPGPIKSMLKVICLQLQLEPQDFEGKELKIPELKKGIIDSLEENPAIVICDDTEQMTKSMLQFLENLLDEIPILLISNPVIPKGIFLKLPRLDLKRLENKEIRRIARGYAKEVELELSPAQLSQIVSRANGIPMLAIRAVEEEHLGLDPSYDETMWVDGTPYLIVILLLFTLVRVVGKGTNNVTLAMIGMGLTIAVRIIQTLLYSLPRQSRKIGG